MNLPDEFWAAVIGAVVGGLVAALLQLLQQSHERGVRQKERLEQQRTLAYSLIYKLMTISSTFTRVSHHLERSFQEAPEGYEPWQFLEAYATPHQHVSFSSDEMTMLLRVSVESFNDIVALDGIHNALSDTLVAYGNKREKITELLPPAMVNGRIGTIVVTHEQIMAARPFIIQANGIARDLRAHASRDAERAWKVMRALVPRINLKLDMKVAIGQKDPGEWLEVADPSLSPANTSRDG